MSTIEQRIQNAPDLEWSSVRVPAGFHVEQATSGGRLYHVSESIGGRYWKLKYQTGKPGDLEWSSPIQNDFASEKAAKRWAAFLAYDNTV